ncbi:unnamed protein product [Penicillium nalgiovense]|uniref:Uncharacterized protein n=1 Tax=Penicillium nalgiovense TaxID=60175 RepID=A0A9W4HBN7_PENNA|nr:unnamed protein product [Penicillium nalgiovense]CAG7958669.1 unnamed protein product [Penicillium nalgiovense]CAG7959235.1 unnamed protein product [Penicillium nalgiovense]CAG7959400.1 unnamed protein product [Penicillium nalgiovense]CAG7968026.1 unnamed protein product [Penicillium nalgiovense]
MLVTSGNAEHQFLRARDQFIAGIQLEVDAIIARSGISPFRLALAVDNLADLIDEVHAIERASLNMYREMPRCPTVLNGCGYYGHKSEFLVKTRKLRGHLVVLQDNLMSRYSDRH